MKKTPFKNSGNSWGKGGSSKTPLERKFLGGGGDANQRVFRGRGMDIFWNHTIEKNRKNSKKKKNNRKLTVIINRKLLFNAKKHLTLICQSRSILHNSANIPSAKPQK